MEYMNFEASYKYATDATVNFINNNMAAVSYLESKCEEIPNSKHLGMLLTLEKLMQPPCAPLEVLPQILEVQLKEWRRRLTPEETEHADLLLGYFEEAERIHREWEKESK